MAAALRTAASGLSKARRQTAVKTARYLDAKAPYLDYPAALAAGWPISSGVIEGTCRHLVKDRMDITGARWGITTAEAVLKLRALQANGDFDTYWTYHLQREHQRNYPTATTSQPNPHSQRAAPIVHRAGYSPRPGAKEVRSVGLAAGQVLTADGSGGGGRRGWRPAVVSPPPLACPFMDAGYARYAET